MLGFAAHLVGMKCWLGAQTEFRAQITPGNVVSSVLLSDTDLRVQRAA